MRKATHRPPNAPSMSGLARAIAELRGEHVPMRPEQQVAELRELELSPYRKRQGELALQVERRRR